MSIVIARIKKKEHVALLKKFIGILNEKAEVVNEDDYRDAFFSQLLQEGRKSKMLSASESGKALKKHGIKI
jgi:hypothetical protein